MEVRELQGDEIREALQIVWEIYSNEIAHKKKDEEVERFKKLLDEEYFLSKVNAGEYAMLAACEGNQIYSVAALDEKNRLLFMFVKRNPRDREIAHMMNESILQYKKHRKATSSVQPLGFGTLLKRGAFVVLCMALAGAGGYRGYEATMATIMDQNLGQTDVLPGESERKPSAEIIPESPAQPEAPEEILEAPAMVEGIASIPVYLDADLPYEMEEVNYTYTSKPGDNCQMYFEVLYPQLTNLDNAVILQQVNKELEECAMSTVNTFYKDPSQEVKEKVVALSSPVLSSGVNYKITYASKDLLCVVFEDHYLAGSTKKSYVDLRTRTFNLNDGSVCEMEDLITLSDDFMNTWLSRAKEEAKGSAVFANLKRDQFRKIFQGEQIGNRYFDAFFLDLGGAQFGLTYHCENGANPQHGWLTVPFSYKELKNYQTENEVWQLLH